MYRSVGQSIGRGLAPVDWDVSESPSGEIGSGGFHMLKLLRGGDVYSPEHLGPADLLITGEQITAIAPQIEFTATGCEIEVIDCHGKILAPGFVDSHNHMLGGGGGNGFASRTPPIRLSQLTRAGITTVVGLLGFDCTTRNLEGLLGLVRALEEEGITAFMFSGATTEHPAVTLTGRIRTDIIYIDKVIGVGELSLSELGPDYPSYEGGAAYVAKVASESLMAGQLSGKSGTVCLQLPMSGFGSLFDILDRTKLPVELFVPSTANAEEQFLEDAIRFAKLGGVVDISSSYSPQGAHPIAVKPSHAIRRALEAGVSVEHVILETDGNGGFPVSATETYYLSVDTLPAEFRATVIEEKVPLADALRVVTANPARALKLGRKGQLRPGADADIVILNRGIEIDQVFARGRLMVDGGRPVVKGRWEDLANV
jgi:beta-aspartyl-dipeptidase (metallo-type)